ncbi:MAG: flagellar biosynthetic protein FliO [Zoogloeaceae bacterium]|jgi:flagellar protein FliO/FliZ|nr:flagellar biosynthetic protein FliO [Zoogloeaceae bacterium]
MRVSSLILAACALALPSRLMAAEDIVPGVPASGVFLQTMGALVFIVLLLFILAALGRKFLTSRTFGQSNLRLLGGLTLGPREQIVLIEAGEDLLVIGIVPGQIRTLHRMKKTVQSPDANPQNNAAPSTPLSFTRALADVLRRLKIPHEKT